MKDIKVIGSGCAKCVKTAESIQQVASEHGIPVRVSKETSPEVMLKYGVMSTPAVVIDSQLVHSGSVPSKGKIAEWLTSA